ncbi:MAG TPA: AbgT family transporter [Candidatus Coprovivens excrementavium]|nr:AbgT family transporter [Candidatus Coprovivens excrementavium]
MNKFKEKITLNPVMTFLILILITIILSGFLNLIGFEATYNKIDVETGEYTVTSESVESLLSLSGIKYIFTSTVSNFTAFTPLSMIIIVLIGIGIMEKSGFIKTTFTILTKYCKKYTITFWLVFISVIMSIAGDLGYVIMIPLAALMFSYGRRNPILGIVAVYAGLTCGSGISILLTSVDSEMMRYTLANALSIDSNYTLGTMCFFFIMTIAALLVSFVITVITERISVNNVEKYEYKDEKKELRLGKREYRGLIFSIIAGAIYLLIFIYNIIPGLPFSGNLLDYTQDFYIDKLFSYDSFFSNGFVFIVTIFFVILGLFYGIGAKTIKNNNDFCEDLTHSLDGTGRTLILILLGSILVNVFKKTNIGTVLTITLSNIIGNGSLSGIMLIVALFLISAISSLFQTGSVAKWAIISTTAIPAFMNGSLSPEFAQVIARFGECATLGLTPLLAYFTIYIAYIEKYNQQDNPVSLFRTLRYQLVYSLIVGAILLLLVVGWYLIGIPIGINGSIST